jgi:hypothetical protein
LIPGATYRFSAGTNGEEAGPRLRREFTVKPGEILDLGEILIERPQSRRKAARTRSARVGQAFQPDADRPNLIRASGWKA